MTETNATYFTLLKKAIASTFLKQHNAPKEIAAWKGEIITLFQEDLLHKTKGSISEKSFYTYFKKEAEKLPRIDVLNILSQYVGFKNWESFKQEHSSVNAIDISETKKIKGTSLLFTIIALLIIASGFYLFNQDHTFKFCLVDEDEQTPLKNKIQIEILQPNESSVFIQADAMSCFKYTTPNEYIKFVVQSPYYKTDTIIRSVKEIKNTYIPLRKDNYALMLKYYSDGNLADIKKRRQQLEKLIATNAQIYQVFPSITGIEVYTKQEFINKMTIPTSALKNLHILDKEYESGKITKLKFIIR